MLGLKQIIMAGTGGQGLVSLATMLAESAMSEGLNTIQTQSYGVAQRGGFISAEVLISDAEILYQQVRVPDVITVLHGVVGARYDEAACPVVYDSTLVSIGTRKDKPNWLGVPCTEIATELGDARAANIVALGAMLAVLPVLTPESMPKAMEDAIKRRFAKAKAQELNSAAFHKGYGIAREALGRQA